MIDMKTATLLSHYCLIAFNTDDLRNTEIWLYKLLKAVIQAIVSLLMFYIKYFLAFFQHKWIMAWSKTY